MAEVDFLPCPTRYPTGWARPLAEVCLQAAELRVATLSEVEQLLDAMDSGLLEETMLPLFWALLLLGLNPGSRALH